jgi:perosamine synthetase
VPISGYIKGLHTEPWVEHILGLREYKEMYSASRIKQYRESIILPNCDLVGQEMLTIGGSAQLLGSKVDMDDIAKALIKVYENRDKLNNI